MVEWANFMCPGGKTDKIYQAAIYWLQRGYDTVISQIFGPKYPKISARQLDPYTALQRKEDITIIYWQKTNHGHMDVFEDARKQLEKPSLNFLVVIRFHPGHLQPKTLVNSFGALILQLLIKMLQYK